MANGNGTAPPSRPGMPGQAPPMKKSTRNWLLIGGGVLALGAFYYVMKARAQATSTSSSTDPSIDPSTGIPYAQEYGGYGAAMGTTPSLYGYYDPATGGYVTGVGATGSYVTAPSTNASWAQQVESYLVTLGYDSQAVAGALGKYLTGQRLTSDQAAIVAAAQGFYGNPPQGAPPVTTTPPAGQKPPLPSTMPPWLQRYLNLPELAHPTAEQIKKAYAPGRAPSEVGEIYYKGKWYRLPFAGH